MESILNKIFEDMYQNTSKNVSIPYNTITIGDYYQLELSLPGFTKNNVAVTLEYDSKQTPYVVIRSQNITKKETNYRHKNIFYGEFENKFYLPQDVDQTKDFEITFIDGILTIKIAKKENLKPKTFEIK